MQQLSLVLNGSGADHEAMVTNAAATTSENEHFAGSVGSVTGSPRAHGLVCSTMSSPGAPTLDRLPRRDLTGSVERRRESGSGEHHSPGTSLASVLERVGEFGPLSPWDDQRLDALHSLVVLLANVGVDAGVRSVPLPGSGDCAELHLRVLGFLAARTVDRSVFLDAKQSARAERLLQLLLAAG